MEAQARRDDRKSAIWLYCTSTYEEEVPGTVSSLRLMQKWSISKMTSPSMYSGPEFQLAHEYDFVPGILEPYELQIPVLLDSNTESKPLPKSPLSRWSLWISHGVLMSITMLFFVLWARAPSIDDVVPYSPANEAIESIGIIRFNGTLGTPSIYRGPPSAELDAVWDTISFNARPIRMTLEQLLRTGEKPSPVMARYPDEYGGGYLATLEFIHQLHCIDMLRRVSWGGNHSDHGANESSEDHRIHIDHCIEMLRQILMCHGDVTMLTYDWVEGVENPFPNFGIPHRCRNFDKVLNWADEHRVFVPKSKVVRYEDNEDLPSPP